MGPTEEQMGGIVASGGTSGAVPATGGDTGDIIISSDSEKPKMSRPLVLGVIIGVLVLIGGAVAAVVLLNQGKGDNSAQVVTKVDGTTIETADDYKGSFLLYANYVLTGVASTDALPESYDTNGDYPIWDEYENKNKEFMDVASGYLENFREQYMEYVANNEGNIDDILVIAYVDDFNYVRSYVNGDVDITVSDADDANETYYFLRGAEIDVVKNIWEIWSRING